MRVTSRDVARLAGVSQPTVSRALRDRPRVSEATRERVLQAARALGYVPLQSGRILVTQKTRRVAVVAAELVNPFFPSLIMPIHDTLERAGYRMSLLTDRSDEPVDIEPLINGSVDGVLLTTLEVHSVLPHELGRRGIPFVQIGREVDGANADACVFDNADGARAAAELLLQLGHTRIGAIFGPRSTSTGREREEAFRNAIARKGLSIRPEHALQGPFQHQAGYDGLQKLMRASDPPTAVFCGNDVIAFGALNAAHALGISIPCELTVVGFDDIPMAAWDILNLTTITADLGKMAAASCELLLRRMSGAKEPARRVVIPVQVALRGTHGPPRTDIVSPATGIVAVQDEPLRRSREVADTGA